VHREELLSTFLETYLPRRFAVGRGQVMDADDNASAQQDVIVYDALWTPLMLRSAGSQIIPVESVYAAIQVRTTLSARDLATLLKQIASLKKLRPSCTVRRYLPNEGNMGWTPECPLGIVFAYTGPARIDQLASRLKTAQANYPVEHRVDQLWVLGRGAILYSNRDRSLSYRAQGDNLMTARSDIAEDVLAHMYVGLTNHLNSFLGVPPNLLKYAGLPFSLVRAEP
jgi:hypothetical protein